ncbi:hypothetical protein [Anaerosporobacter sp.]
MNIMDSYLNGEKAVDLIIETIKSTDTLKVSRGQYSDIMKDITDDKKQYIQIANRIYFKNQVINITFK